MKQTIVVVLYNCSIEDSPTIQTLYPQLDTINAETYQLILYDNSPRTQKVPTGMKCVYHHDSRNLGISQAYNYALSHAFEFSDWLFLFDQDTQLPNDFLVSTQAVCEDVPQNIVAVVPIVTENGQQISPVSMETFRPLKESQLPQVGIHSERIMGICSGCAVRVGFMEKLGGFSSDFPLDYLDHWLFYTVHANKQQICVTNSILTHKLSVMDFSTMTVNRYRNIINSEALFYRKYYKEVASEYPKHLFFRGMKQLLKVKNKRIGIATLTLCWQFKFKMKTKREEA